MFVSHAFILSSRVSLSMKRVRLCGCTIEAHANNIINNFFSNVIVLIIIFMMFAYLFSSLRSVFPFTNPSNSAFLCNFTAVFEFLHYIITC